MSTLTSFFMPILFYFIIFLFGLAVGSFLNALIYRLYFGGSVIFGRSMCPKCKHELSALDLIPVVSFFLLRWKCRYCRGKISWQYPVVEIVVAILFLLTAIDVSARGTWQVAQLLLNLIFSLFFISALVVVFVYDLKYYLILDKVVFPAIVVAFIAALVLPDANIWNALLGSAICGGFFLILVLLSKEKWMGAGDAKLGFLVGLIVPFPEVFVLLIIAFVGGSIISLFLVALKKKTMKDAVPFGTFLAASAVISMFVGKEIIAVMF
ncbi:MAG: type II secretory pathway, prepilin signal peptidase PulO [uncultured bacterium]|nr:MAG: type II secretory pathway, prepilin signal peptidase PulO [uncultured bacterium]